MPVFPRCALPLAVLVAAMPAAHAAPCPDGAGPRAAVEGYLTAMQESRFTDAYEFVNANMTDGRVRSEWAGMQKLFFEAGGVSIYKFDVREPHGTDDDPGCAARALVPNVLHSRDKFNNQGTVEFEVYTVAKGGDAWQVDAQETLFDEADIRVWFPDDEIPEFRDQY